MVNAFEYAHASYRENAMKINQLLEILTAVVRCGLKMRLSKVLLFSMHLR